MINSDARIKNVIADLEGMRREAVRIDSMDKIGIEDLMREIKLICGIDDICEKYGIEYDERNFGNLSVEIFRVKRTKERDLVEIESAIKEIQEMINGFYKRYGIALMTKIQPERK